MYAYMYVCMHVFSSLCLLPVNQPGLEYIDFKEDMQGKKGT